MKIVPLQFAGQKVKTTTKPVPYVPGKVYLLGTLVVKDGEVFRVLRGGTTNGISLSPVNKPKVVEEPNKVNKTPARPKNKRRGVLPASLVPPIGSEGVAMSDSEFQRKHGRRPNNSEREPFSRTGKRSGKRQEDAEEE